MSAREHHLRNTVTHLRTWIRERGPLVANGESITEKVAHILDRAEPLIDTDYFAAELEVGKALALAELANQFRPVPTDDGPVTGKGEIQ